MYVSWSASELRVRLGLWNRFKPSSKMFLLTVSRRCFFCGSFMLFLSWFCYAFVSVCLSMSCGHLLGKDWPLGSRLCCLIAKLSFPIGILGQVWCLLVSIPDLCPLSYLGFWPIMVALNQATFPPLQFFLLSVETVWLKYKEVRTAIIAVRTSLYPNVHCLAQARY